jgi:hypothetical protein
MSSFFIDGSKLPSDYALQHPQDYLDSMISAIRECIERSGISPELIIGVGVDFTASTVLHVTEDGTPLCFTEKFKNTPHAYVKLWKHHAAQQEADDINRLANSTNAEWIKRYGGTISCEWLFPKVLQVLREAPEVYDRTFRFIEAGDWIVWMLTGIWDGAGYNFVLWGFVLWTALMIEKFFLLKYLNKWPVFGHLYMFLMIPLTWAIFAIDDIQQLGVFFTRLFPFFGQGPHSEYGMDYLESWQLYYPFLLIAAFFSTRLPFKLLEKIKNCKIVVWLILLAILGGSIYCMYQGYDDPFLYFRF